MNTTFFHDTNFVKSSANKYYTLGAMNKEKFDEYKEDFGNITAVVKVTTENENNKAAICDKNFVGNIEVREVAPNFKNCISVVKKQMKKSDFAIIRMPSIIGTVACREARKQKVPYMIEMVGCPRNSLWYHGGIKYKLALPFLVMINKYELKHSKNTIYVTEKFLQKRYPTNGKYIGCSDVVIKDIDENVLEERIKKIQAKNEKDIYKLGIIGSLNTNYKGHKTAIKALSKIKENTNIELHFVGSGNKNRWIKLAKKYNIEDKIFFEGILSHDKVFEWLDDIDIYLIPSLTEGMPRALIEAMSRGCPCIGCLTGGIPELLDDDMIIKKKDDKGLKTKIVELMHNKNLMLEQAKANFKKSKQFEKNILKQKKEKFIEQMLIECKEQK